MFVQNQENEMGLANLNSEKKLKEGAFDDKENVKVKEFLRVEELAKLKQTQNLGITSGTGTELLSPNQGDQQLR